MSGLIVTPWDIEVLARTLYGEARSEPDAGKTAIAWVILNRVTDRRWPKTIAGVCLQPKQFSAWNERDPNRTKLIGVTLLDEHFAACMAVAWSVIGGVAPDPTKGANHYLTTELAERSPPPWFDRQHVVGRLGAHLFLKL
jgi:spore germination cell wall hydrolase CwlJ-like protein